MSTSNPSAVEPVTGEQPSADIIPFHPSSIASLIRASHAHVPSTSVELFYFDKEGRWTTLSTIPADDGGKIAAAVREAEKAAGGHVHATIPGIRLAFRDPARADAAAAKLAPSFRIGSSLIYLFGPSEAVDSLLDALKAQDDDDAYAADDMRLPYGNVDLSEPLTAQTEFEVFEVAEFEAAFFEDDDALASPAASKLNDAEVYGDIFSNPILNTPVRISVAAKADEKVFNVSPEVKFSDLLISNLSKIRVGKKDGKCFVPGVLMEGRRLNNAVTKLYMMGLDVDSGASMEETMAKLRDMGLFFVAYTTHSHGTRFIEVKKDRYYKWAGNNEYDDEPTTETVKKFLTDEGKYTADVIASAEYVETRHEVTGIQIIVRTRPIDKFRLVFILDKPYIIADQKSSQKAAITAWGDMILGMGVALGISVDRAARDCSRLFYLPSRDKSASSARIVICDGKALDWTKITKVSLRGGAVSSDPFDQAAVILGGKGDGTRPESPGGVDLKSWASETAHGFQISSVFKDHCDDRIRAETGPGKFSCECPFDDDHSNAGDPDDPGCFIQDAGMDAESFTFRCSHDSCAAHDRLAMLQKAMEDGWFADDVLTDPDYNIAGEDTDYEGQVSDERETKFLSLNALIKKADAEKQSDGFVSEPTMEALMECVAKQKSRVAIYERIKALKLTGLTAFRVDVEKRARTHARKAGKERPQGGGAVFSDEDFRVAMPKVRAALRKRNTPPYMFLYGDRLVRVAAGGRLSVEPMDERALRYEATEAIDFRRVNGDDKDQGERIPKDIAEHLIDDPVKSFADPLRRIVYAPMASPDGTVKQPPDADSWYYDAALEHLIDGRGMRVPAVSVAPSDDDVKLAVRILDKVLAEFPFTDDFAGGKDAGLSSKANAIGFILIPFLRDFYDGCTPLILLDKSKPGSGGSFLAEVAYMIAHGSNLGGGPLPDTEDEIRKAITSAKLAGDDFKLWDNIKRRLDSPTIASLLTIPEWEDRELGKNKRLKLPNLGTLVVTGNNISMSDEIARRCFPIRMETGRPSNDGRKFKREAPLRDLRMMRGHVVWACLTLVTNWIAKGKRKVSIDFPNYYDFAGVVGGCMEDAGIKGFLSNRKAFLSAKKTEDRHVTAMMEALLSRWGTTPFSAAEAVTEIFDDAGLGGAKFGGLGITARNDDTATKSTELESRFAKRMGAYELHGQTYQFRSEPTTGGLKWKLEPTKAVMTM